MYSLDQKKTMKQEKLPVFRSRYEQKYIKKIEYYRVQTGSGAHPASYPMGTGGSFLGGKVAGS